MVKKWWPKFLTTQKQEKVRRSALAPGTSRHRPHTHSGSPLGLQGRFGLESHCHRGDHVGALRWSCGGNQSKEGHVTAGRLLNPPPHFCCSLPWDSVPSDGSSAVPRSARSLPAASLHGRLPALRPCRRDRPVSGTDRYFSPSSHGPAVQGAPRVRKLPPRAAIETEACRDGSCYVPRAPRCCLSPRDTAAHHAQVRLHRR